MATPTGLTSLHTRKVVPEALQIRILLDDGYTVRSECMFSGLNEGGMSAADKLIPPLNAHLSHKLEHMDAGRFKENETSFRDDPAMSDIADVALKYCISQALLAVASYARKKSMAAILSHDWGTRLASAPIELLVQTGPDWREGVDKITEIRSKAIHTRSPRNLGMFAAVPETLSYIREKVLATAPESYRPIVHMNMNGLLGAMLGLNAAAIASYLMQWSDLIRPLRLIVVDPVIAEDKLSQIHILQGICPVLESSSSFVDIMADRYFNSTADFKDPAELPGAIYRKVSPPSIGYISDIMDIFDDSDKLRYRDRYYLARSGAETFDMARTRANLAMAVSPGFTLAGPGSSAEEAHAFMMSEMQRICSSQAHRNSALC